MNLGLYIIKRLMIIIPTILGITVVNFAILNMAPGGPIEQKIRQLRFAEGDQGTNQTTEGVSKEVIEALKKQYGFDKSPVERYFIWLKNLIKMDFGESFKYEEPVIDVIKSKLPVSIQFGLASFILTYLICIPLGIFKAMKDGTSFDFLSSAILSAMYSIPGFMLGILLIVYFAGDTFLDIFPMGELYSDNYEDMSFLGKVWDRIHHFVLPLTSYMVGSFTTLTLLMKNSILEEIRKDYIRTARAKGLNEKTVYLKHALRNALIPVVTGIGNFLMLFFAGSFLIETIFQLDGIGLLSYNSLMERDYNVLMGMMFITSLLYLLGNLISDILYVVVDPRIDFK